MDDRDSEQTYALMFVDDPLLAVKPIYMAKSDSNNGHKGFDWSIYAYAHDFYGYMEIVNGMDHSKRASSFTFNGREWADYYNSYNFKEKGQLPSGCYYERDLEYLGMECRQYAIYNDDDKTELYKVYYVTKDSNVTVFIENYKARTNRSVTEYKPIASDEEYDAMDQDTQKKYLKKSDISKSVRELNKNDSRRDLVINEDRPEKSQYYSMNVSSHGNSGYSYDYNYYGTTILSHYYYGIIFGYPDNPFEVGIDDLYKVNFIAEDRPGYEFDYWEIYDWETQTWDFFSDDIDYACNYVKLNSNRTEYIEDTRIKDATKVRAVYREAPPCHVRVEGGFFTENYTVTNVSEGDVLKGINIYIIPDRNRIPEGNELEYWEGSINGGEVIRIDLGSITVTGDMVLTPVYKDIICDVYFYGEGGEVTDDFSECSMGATITVKTTANEGYTTFLGWYKLNFGMDRIEYELITTSTTLSYVVDEDYIQFIARWSDGTINEEPYCDITIDNGFGSRGYNGIFVSSLRLGDYSRVTMVKDPYQTGIVSKWTVTGQFDDGIDYYEEIYDIFEDESEYFIYSCADLPEKITITAVMAQCTEHDWDEGVITKPASHIEEGIITYTCLFCGEKRIEVIPKTSEHTYGRWQKHNAEQHMRVCECGDIEYADHNW
ncbi:MAG: hypothetical protein GX815_14890, partial [Clostridiales bacterium]|nr:hypothetical protein [Clostridiales bacterium]